VIRNKTNIDKKQTAESMSSSVLCGAAIMCQRRLPIHVVKVIAADVRRAKFCLQLLYLCVTDNGTWRTTENCRRRW